MVNPAPGTPARESPPEQPLAPLQEARQQLRVASVPEQLPCREEECAEVYCFLDSRLRDGRGGCFYISGGPGTGKTTTIMEAVRMVEESREELPEFRVISVCGLSLTCPEEAYVKMWQGLSDQVGYVFVICL